MKLVRRTQKPGTRDLVKDRAATNLVLGSCSGAFHIYRGDNRVSSSLLQVVSHVTLILLISVGE